MVRFSSLALVTLSGFAFGAEPKAKPIEQPAEVRAVLAELGVARAPKDLLEVPNDYAKDTISLEEIRMDPKTYPFRAGVLRTADVLKIARKIEPIKEYKHDLPKWRETIKAKQIPIAAAINDLDEAIADLHALESERSNEKSKRWKAHYDFLLAEAMYRLVALYELDKAYARVLVDQLPEPAAEVKQPVYKLVAVEKLQSLRDLRDQMTIAKGKLTATIREFRARDGMAPWLYLADELLENPAGLKWELVAESK